MSKRTAYLALLASLAWGFAEATFFFFVPDILLSLIALYRPRVAYVGCVCATLGAILGGLLMYYAGVFHYDGAVAFLDLIPAINHDLILSVRQALSDTGLLALLLGPTQGVPYKIYAVEAGSLGMSLLAFVLVSIPARFVRFAFVTGAAHVFGRLMGRFPRRYAVAVVTGCWILVYVVYFAAMPS
jgi:membrane protein YqaA with SNARE-associated domain